MSVALAQPPARDYSLAERVARLPKPERVEFLASLTDAEASALDTDWRFWGRTAQQAPPGEWFAWYVVTGRGWGKNAAAAHWYHDEALKRPGQLGFLASRTVADVRDTVLFHPRSGILSTQLPENPCEYLPSMRTVEWKNGFKARLYSSERPDQGRGPEHDVGYGDEFAAWRADKDASGNTLYDNLLMGLRGGASPRAVFTSTPRPIALVRDVLKKASPDGPIRSTRGTLFDNAANLPPIFVSQMVERYTGRARLWRQEMLGEVVDTVDGALWTQDLIDSLRRTPEQVPKLRRIVIAVDPAVSSEEGSNKTGIVGCARGDDDHGYALKRSSGVFTPIEWAQRAVDLYHELDADLIVGEKNNGGDMVASTLRTVAPNIPVKLVHATRGKGKRAEPISALAAQGRLHDVEPVDQWRELDDQRCTTTPDGYQGDGSPDDLDAYVWGMTELFIKSTGLSPRDLYGA